MHRDEIFVYIPGEISFARDNQLVSKRYFTKRYLSITISGNGLLYA